MAINNIIAQQQPSGSPMSGQQPPVGGQPPMGGQPSVQQQDETVPTDQEQQDYEKVVLAGVDILSDEKTGPLAMQALQAGQADPAKSLASVTARIFSQIDEKSGGKVPEVVIANAAGEILEQVVEFANKSGVMQIDKPTQDRAAQHLWMEFENMGYDIEPDDMSSLVQGMSEEELQGLVQEQGAAQAGGQAPQAPRQPQQQAPVQPQKMPGIINQTVGG